MSMLATRPITSAARTAGERRAAVDRRRKLIAAAIDGERWAAETIAELELAGELGDPVVTEAIAHDMTCAVTDVVVW